MKINITIELDKKSAEVFQIPFKKLSKQINELIEMFDKVEYVIEDAPDIEPKQDLEPKPPKKHKQSQKPQVAQKPKKTQKPKKPQIPVKATIFEAIKEHNGGVSTKELQTQTGFTSKQISNNMFHLRASCR